MASVPPPSRVAPGTSGSIDTVIRNLRMASKRGFPLSSVRALREELRLQRGKSVQWSEALARELGALVTNCVRSRSLIDPSYQPAVDGANAIQWNQQQHEEEPVSATALGLLAIAMEDWEDHVLYAVVVQDFDEKLRADRLGGREHQSSEPKNKLVDCEHLLDVLTLLSAQSEHPNITSHECESIRENATVCLATAWRCLERLESVTTMSNGTPWWIVEGKQTNLLAVASLQSLCQIYCGSGSEADDEFCLRQLQHDGSTLDEDQRKVSMLTIIAILLRYQLLDLSTSSVSSAISASSSIGGCILPERKLSELTSKLIREIQVLNHSVLSPSSSEYTLPIAMLSLSVLSLLQRSLVLSENDSLFHGMNQTIQSTGLVENLAQFTFVSSVFTEENGGTSSIRAPRWMTSSPNSFRRGYLQSFGLLLFSCWSFCDNAAWKALVANLEPKLNSLIDSFWSNLLENGFHNHQNLSMEDGCDLEGQLPGILWLYLYMRSHARYRLNKVFEKTLGDRGRASNLQQPPFGDSTENCTSTDRASGKLIRSLFGTLRLSPGTSYSSRLMIARLLRVLLADRRIVASDDHLSRCLWTAVDESVVKDHFEAVLEHANTDDANQPLLLALVDTMETMLEHNKYCNCLVDKLGAHNLESLIYLVKPKTVRYDFCLGMDESVVDTDTETPPLHNLSRMDETSICIEHEETKKPRGLDHSVRLSVATALAHLAYGSLVSPPDESTGFLVSRISTAVNDFVCDYNAVVERGGNAEENGDGMGTSTPSMDHIKRFTRLQFRIATPGNEDFLSTMLFTSLSLRKKTISKFVDAQKETNDKLKMTLQREKKAQEEKMRLQQQLRTQSILFQREMSRTKLNLTQDTRQLVSMHASERSNAEERSIKLQQQTEIATAELERVKTELQAAQAELQTTRSTVDELNGTISRLQQEVKDERVKADEVVKEAQAGQEAIQSYEEKCDDMQNAIDERDDAISRVEDTNEKLQDNLEDLFADMCSLSQMYQHNEKQQESQKLKNGEAIEAVNQKLATERQNNKELSSKIEDIEEENEKLYRKLEKYKDRLQQERKDRREEQERKKEAEHRRKRNGPVSYLNSLHASSSVDIDSSRSRSMRSSRDRTPSSERPPTQHKSRDRSTYDKENSSGNYRSSTSQRRAKY
jgi:hypothetical protein